VIQSITSRGGRNVDAQRARLDSHHLLTRERELVGPDWAM
jgi:hypothetical protein